MDYGTLKRHLWPLPLEIMMFGGLVAAFFTYHKGMSALHFTAPAFAVLVSFAPLGLERLARIRIPARLQLIFVLFIVASLFAGTYLGLYGVWTFWDKVIHFCSGALVAVYALTILAVIARKYRLAIPLALRAVLVVALGGLVALLWEISEFIGDTYFGTHAQLSNADTMTDMINGLLGATIVVVSVVWQYAKRGKTWLDGLMVEARQLNDR